MGPSKIQISWWKMRESEEDSIWSLNSGGLEFNFPIVNWHEKVSGEALDEDFEEPLSFIFRELNSPLKKPSDESSPPPLHQHNRWKRKIFFPSKRMWQWNLLDDFLRLVFWPFDMLFSPWNPLVISWAEVVVVVCLAHRFSVIGWSCCFLWFSSELSSAMIGLLLLFHSFSLGYLSFPPWKLLFLFLLCCDVSSWLVRFLFEASILWGASH